MMQPHKTMWIFYAPWCLTCYKSWISLDQKTIVAQTLLLIWTTHHLWFYTILQEDQLNVKFRRIETNVGPVDAPVTYNARVNAPKGIKIIVSPQGLHFEKKNQTRSCNLTVKYEVEPTIEIAHGELVWVEENGYHKVRSPVVVALDFHFASRGLC